VKKIQKSGAVYSEDKLLWYNSKYIQSIKLGKLVEYLSDFVPPEWLDNKEFFEKVVSVERERIKKLTDFRETADLFFEMPNYEADMLVWKDKRSESLGNLKKIHEYVESLSEDTFDQENLEKYLLDLSRESGGKGEVFWPFRVAMSGKKASPGGLEIAEVIGFRKTKERLKLAVDKADSLYMLD
jgi:glutamyl/glutaminyl-tRNA synthetase